MRAIASKLKSMTKTIKFESGSILAQDGQEIGHNGFVTITSSLLRTGQGTADMDNCMRQRIGCQIRLSGVSIKCKMEHNERGSDVSFRILIVRCANGDTPTPSTLKQGNSSNKMIDTINTERYSILAPKYNIYIYMYIYIHIYI